MNYRNDQWHIFAFINLLHFKLYKLILMYNKQTQFNNEQQCILKWPTQGY